MKTLTVFTPTYNRAHTLERTYRSLCRQTCKDFEWLVIDDGSTDDTRSLIDSFISENIIPIKYIYKENGGLYTGYNTAYANITTELNVCIDSDDFMPDNAVELIVGTWKEKGSGRYAGIIGLDYYAGSQQPIGGKFPEDMEECYFLDLYIKNIHRGDTKQIMRTDLMRAVAPQIGFSGEKNFNPVYMLLQICDDYPLIVLNKNLCFVEYQQSDSMSRNIYNQYFDSPRSFAKMRVLEMRLKRNSVLNKLRSAVHYVAECIIANRYEFTFPIMTRLLIWIAVPFGVMLYLYLKVHNSKL